MGFLLFLRHYRAQSLKWFISEQLEKNRAFIDVFGEVVRRKSLLSKKKNPGSSAEVAKLLLNKPQKFWNNVLWTDAT